MFNLQIFHCSSNCLSKAGLGLDLVLDWGSIGVQLFIWGFFLLGGGGIRGGPQGVAAGEGDTPEESKDFPNSGVTSTGMSRECVLGGAGVEPGRCALGGKFRILCRWGGGERLNSDVTPLLLPPSFFSSCPLLLPSFKSSLFELILKKRKYLQLIKEKVSSASG